MVSLVITTNGEPGPDVRHRGVVDAGWVHSERSKCGHGHYKSCIIKEALCVCNDFDVVYGAIADRFGSDQGCRGLFVVCVQSPMRFAIARKGARRTQISGQGRSHPLSVSSRSMRRRRRRPWSTTSILSKKSSMAH